MTTRCWLTFAPTSRSSARRHGAPSLDRRRISALAGHDLLTVIPRDGNAAYDMRLVISRLVDGGSFSGHPDFGAP